MGSSSVNDAIDQFKTDSLDVKLALLDSTEGVFLRALDNQIDSVWKDGYPYPALSASGTIFTLTGSTIEAAYKSIYETHGVNAGIAGISSRAIASNGISNLVYDWATEDTTIGSGVASTHKHKHDVTKALVNTLYHLVSKGYTASQSAVERVNTNAASSTVANTALTGLSSQAATRKTEALSRVTRMLAANGGWYNGFAVDRAAEVAREYDSDLLAEQARVEVSMRQLYETVLQNYMGMISGYRNPVLADTAMMNGTMFSFVDGTSRITQADSALRQALLDAGVHYDEIVRKDTYNSSIGRWNSSLDLLQRWTNTIAGLTSGIPEPQKTPAERTIGLITGGISAAVGVAGLFMGGGAGGAGK